MKNPPVSWFLFLIIFLSACSAQAAPTVTAVPSPTPTHTPIFKPTLTVTPTFRPTLTATLTDIPTPFYPTKQILFIYQSGGWHSSFFDMVHDATFTGLVLYTDGQMIVNGMQKTLSKPEMDAFFAQLKALGYYNIEVDEDGNSTNSLYTPDNPFEKITDGSYTCVEEITDEKKRNICSYEPYQEYLIPEMKAILTFLDAYPTKGMTPYIPDRIVLYVEPVDTIQGIVTSELTKDVIDWPEYLPRLKPVTSDYKLMYLQGFMAGKVSAYMDSVRLKDGPNVFRQDGIDYVVAMDTILPYEALSFEYLQP